MKALKIFLFIILFASILLFEVGFAQLSSLLLVEGRADAAPQRGVFFLDAQTPNENATVNSSLSTLFNSTVVLGASADATATFTLTLFNNSVDHYAYVEATHAEDIQGAYTNPNIVYSHTLEKYTSKIHPDETLVFTLTFSYKEGYTPVAEETLDSLIHFQFALFGENENTSYGDYINCFLHDPNKGYGLNDTNKKGKAVEAAVQKANPYLYPTDKIQGGNLDHLSNGVTEGLTYVYEKHTDTIFYLYTLEKADCTAANASNSAAPIIVYKSILVKDTEWRIQETISGVAKVIKRGSTYHIDPTTWVPNYLSL